MPDREIHSLNCIWVCLLQVIPGPAPRLPVTLIFCARINAQKQWKQISGLNVKVCAGKHGLFKVTFCIELLESNFPSVICLPKVPTLVQIELKVQEVLTKGIGSKISEESAYLRLASLSSWVCPPRLGRPVSNLRIFFFSILALPTQTRELSGRQAGRQAGGESCSSMHGAYLYLHPSPGPLATLPPPQEEPEPRPGSTGGFCPPR